MSVQRCCQSCLRVLYQNRRVISGQTSGLSRWFSAEAAAATQPISPPPMATQPISPPPMAREPISPPPMAGEPKIYPEKIEKIVADISTLTLLETSQLNELLKTTLNIPDAPVMAVAAPAAQQQEEEEAPKEVQTAFTVKLMKFADDSKIKLIKEVKAQMEGMNLVQAKKLVESLPQEFKTNLKKEEADKLAAALEAAGGTVELV